MKKKYMLMGIAAVLILATMVGGTLAALNTKSEKAVANISIKSVGVTMIGDQPVALAARYGVTMPEDELLLKANQWELSHGGLTGRAAQQFIDYIVGTEEEKRK